MCRRNHCCPNGFYEELQVLRCESQSHHSVDVPDVLSVWSSTDLHNVAQFATVEAKTAMRVFLHRVGAVQVHRLGGWRHGSSRRLGEGGGGGRGGSSGGSDDRRGAEQGQLSGGSLRLGVFEPPLLIVKQGVRALPLFS